MLAFQIVLNGTNAGLDAWFVARLGWGPAGIGAGTAIAEWLALAFGLILVATAFRGHARLLDPGKLAALFAANRDIMIRTLALVFCFAWFVRSGTLISTAATAGNEVLLQFITVAAFVLDGFAFVAEKEAGEAYGARDGQRLRRAMRLTTEFALVSGAVISLAYFLGGGWVIDSFIRDPEARAAALAYLPWCAAVPFLGIAAWQLDGLFLGTTQGRALRNAGLISAALYLGADLLLRPAYGNTGVWAAFLMMYVFRAAALGAYVPGLFRGLSRPPLPAT
jgi:MATE family multidrug resistance protein